MSLSVLVVSRRGNQGIAAILNSSPDFRFRKKSANVCRAASSAFLADNSRPSMESARYLRVFRGYRSPPSVDLPPILVLDLSLGGGAVIHSRARREIIDMVCARFVQRK